MTNNDEERGKKENKCHNRDKIKIKIVQWQKYEKILENTIKKENKSWVDAKIYVAYAIIKKNELGKLKTQRTLFQDQKKSF